MRATSAEKISAFFFQTVILYTVEKRRLKLPRGAADFTLEIYNIGKRNRINLNTNNTQNNITHCKCILIFVWPKICFLSGSSAGNQDSHADQQIQAKI